MGGMCRTSFFCGPPSKSSDELMIDFTFMKCAIPKRRRQGLTLYVRHAVLFLLKLIFYPIMALYKITSIVETRQDRSDSWAALQLALTLTGTVVFQRATTHFCFCTFPIYPSLYFLSNVSLGNAISPF
jgi:hypothetical protein